MKGMTTGGPLRYCKTTWERRRAEQRGKGTSRPLLPALYLTSQPLRSHGSQPRDPEVSGDNSWWIAWPNGRSNLELHAFPSLHSSDVSEGLSYQIISWRAAQMKPNYNTVMLFFFFNPCFYYQLFPPNTYKGVVHKCTCELFVRTEKNDEALGMS